MQSPANKGEPHQHNMVSLLRKVRERNNRTCAEKSAKWGLDFTNTHIKPLEDNAGTVKSDSSKAYAIDWKPIVWPTDADESK